MEIRIWSTFVTCVTIITRKNDFYHSMSTSIIFTCRESSTAISSSHMCLLVSLSSSEMSQDPNRNGLRVTRFATPPSCSSYLLHNYPFKPSTQFYFNISYARYHGTSLTYHSYLLNCSFTTSACRSNFIYRNFKIIS